MLRPLQRLLKVMPGGADSNTLHHSGSN